MHIRFQGICAFDFLCPGCVMFLPNYFMFFVEKCMSEYYFQSTNLSVALKYICQDVVLVILFVLSYGM